MSIKPDVREYYENFRDLMVDLLEMSSQYIDFVDRVVYKGLIGGHYVDLLGSIDDIEFSYAEDGEIYIRLKLPTHRVLIEFDNEDSCYILSRNGVDLLNGISLRYDEICDNDKLFEVFDDIIKG